MADPDTNLAVDCDFTPNHAKEPFLAVGLREKLLLDCEKGADEVISRLATLPILMVYHPFGEYVPLLREAREIYTRGYFYACVAMCGITAERLVKDILRGSLMVRSGPNSASSPSALAFDQLERIDVSSLARFLAKASLIDDQAWKSLDALFQLRNTYAHARGKDPEADALKAIQHLHSTPLSIRRRRF